MIMMMMAIVGMSRIIMKINNIYDDGDNKENMMMMLMTIILLIRMVMIDHDHYNDSEQ